MEIRPASVADAAGITALHMKALDPSTSDFTPLGRRIVERFYRNAVTRGLGRAIVAADGDERIGGFVLVTRDVQALFTHSLLDGPADILRFLVLARPQGLLSAALAKLRSGTAAVPAVPELVYLAVDERMRGHGIGRRLMDAAERWFAEAEIGQYELNVHADNGSAFHLYTSHGMRIVRTYVKNGATMHTLRKRVELSEAP